MVACERDFGRANIGARVKTENHEGTIMLDSLYGARLQGFTVVVFIVAKSRAWFDEYIYHDSLQARVIEGIGHSPPLILFLRGQEARSG